MASTHFTVTLVPHPETPPQEIDGVDVRWFETGDGKLVLRWLVKRAEAVAAPPFAGKGRGHELWQTTCGELFVRDGKGYREFNFSPSERWAAYRFEGYRDGMADAEIAIPDVTSDKGEYLFVLTAILDAGVLADAEAAGLCAVIEETNGTKSYWALAHPPGKPDFHDPACFALPLPVSARQ